MGIAAAVSMLGATLTSTRVASAGDARARASPSPESAHRCRARRAATDADATTADADIATLFAEYQCWLGAAEYREALEALERACDGSDDAACPFNRALVHHAWLELPGELDREHCRIARSNYARYLALEPYEEQSDAARSALAELASICNPDPPVPASEPAVATDVIPAIEGHVSVSATPALGKTTPEQHGAPGTPPLGPAPAERSLPSERPRTLPWLLLGAGSASALATSVAWLSMSRADADLARHARAGVVYPSRETESLDASRRRYHGWVWGFGASAVALLGAGTTLLLVDPSLPPYLSVSVAPGLAVVGYDAIF